MPRIEKFDTKWKYKKTNEHAPSGIELKIYLMVPKKDTSRSHEP
jgi:hypothetical protein